jgi:hypothetical protein
MKLSNKYPLSYFHQGGKDEKLNFSFPYGGRQGMGVSNNKTKSKIVII